MLILTKFLENQHRFSYWILFSMRKRILENAKGHIELMLLCMYNCL